MIKVILLLIAAALTITACARDSERSKVRTIEASATASKDSDGHITTHEPTPSDLDDLKKGRALYDAIDAQFPKPSRPAGASRMKAKAVSPSGEIQLEDGRTLVMDGVTCSAEGAQYLGRLLTGPKDFIIFEPTGPSSSGVIPANVWVVDDLDGGGEGELFPADGAVTSGWCSAHKTQTSKLNQRFTALEAAFAKERAEYAP
jgi:hypothetical protein